MKSLKRLWRGFSLLPSLLTLYLRFFLDRLLGKRRILWEIQLPAQTAYVKEVLAALGERREISLSFLPPIQPIPDLPRRRTLPDVSPSWYPPFDLFISLSQYTRGIPPRARRSLLIPHSLPSKGNSIIPQTFLFDHLFLTGPLLEELFQEALEKCPPPQRPKTRAHRAGYPKSDSLFSAPPARRAKGQRPALLYAPAYEPRTSLDLYGEEIVRVLLEEDVNLWVRLHPMYSNPLWIERIGVHWSARLEERFSSHPRFHMDDSSDSYIRLRETDLLITDVSGVALEYCLLNRGPIVYIDCPGFFSQTLPEMFGLTWRDPQNDDRVNVGRHTGRVTDLEGLGRSVREALANPGEGSEARRAYNNRLLFHPGEGTGNYLRLIDEILADHFG